MITAADNDPVSIRVTATNRRLIISRWQLCDWQYRMGLPTDMFASQPF